AHPRGLLLRHGRPSQQQLGQQALGLRAEEIHHRQSAAPLVAPAPRADVLVLSRYNARDRSLLRVLILNLVVAGAKLVLGYATRAVSVISAGFHSLSASASNSLAFVALRASLKPPDDDHPYGHCKSEGVATGGFFFFLLLVVID